MKNKVLFYFLKELRTATVKVPRGTDFSTIQAGTPLSEAGAIANDATAYGIVMHNHQKEWTREATINGYANVTVIVAGYIDEAAAEASCGLEYTDALKGALNDIVFVDGEIGSGGGGGQPTEKDERTVYIPEQTFSGTEDKGAYRTSIESNFSELGYPDVLNVEFDGTLYSASLRANGTSYGDGDGSFSEFPFFIQASVSEVMVADGNSHTISAYTGNIIYSGASIPDYTAEDMGKVLTIGEVDGDERVTVIPEQEVELHPAGSGGPAHYILTDVSLDADNGSPSSFTLIVNEVAYDMEYDEGGGVWLDLNFRLVLNNGVWRFFKMGSIALPSFANVSAYTMSKKPAPVWGDGGGAFIVNDNDLTADKTWAEIKSAYDNGKMVILHVQEAELTWDSLPLIQLSIEEGKSDTSYYAVFINSTGNGQKVYTATSADGNLTTSSDGGAM